MAQLVVDEVMLREPRLLVPGMQPYGRVRLNPRFSGGDALVASHYPTTVRGGTITLPVTNPAYTGSRLNSIQATGRALRVYADSGGNSDDSPTWYCSLPTALAGPLTTVIQYIPLSQVTGSQKYDPNNGHKIEIYESTGNILIGYFGGNGYDFYYNGSTPYGAGIFGTVLNVVISTSISPPRLSMAINGVSITANTNSESYVGGGTRPSSVTPTFGHPEFTTHYRPNSHLFLWGLFPKLFLSKDEAVSLSANIYQMFDPA